MSAPLEEPSFELGPGIASRASFCQRVLGVEVCVDASVDGNGIRVRFKVAGATIFDKYMDGNFIVTLFNGADAFQLKRQHHLLVLRQSIWDALIFKLNL